MEEDFKEDDWEAEVDWEPENLQEEKNERNLNIVISAENINDEKTSSGPVAKKRRVFTPKYFDHDYERALSRCKDNFSFLIRKIKNVTEWSIDPEFLCILQSLLPNDLLQRFSSQKGYSLEDIHAVSAWLSESFTKLPSTDMTEDEGRDGSAPEDLINLVLANKAASNVQFTQLFYGILSSFQIRCRICSCVDPLSFSPHDYEDLGSEETKKYKLAKMKVLNKVTSQIYCWVEILVSTSTTSNDAPPENIRILQRDHLHLSTIPKDQTQSQQRWLQYDSFQNIIDNPEAVEKLVRKNKEIMFVISCENRSNIVETGHNANNHPFILTDLSAKYKFLPSKRIPVTMKLKNNDALLRSWLERKLEEDSMNSFSLSPHHSSLSIITPASTVFDLSVNSTLIDLTSDESAFSTVQPSLMTTSASSAVVPGNPLDEITALQQEKFIEQQQLRRNENINLSTLPTTFQSFQNHPIYLLERHLKSNETLHPEKKKAVAIFKGEAVYLQEHKEIMKTKLDWRKELRQVLPDEKPMKTVKKSVRIEEEGSEGRYRHEMKERELYAKFQTIPLQIPAVTADGILPINKYGNIEVWDGLPQFVPDGAVYIEGGARVMKVAKLLEIPFAPAVVDFEFKNGRYYPKIGGIVVLKQSKQLIEDSFYEFSAFQEETEYEKFQQKIYDRWKKIIRLLLSRERLRETYGH